MSEYHDYGPLQTYEVQWRTGTVEMILAHQVLTPNKFAFDPAGRTSYLFHGEFDGRWRLVLAADGELIASVRNVTVLDEPSLWSRVKDALVRAWRWTDGPVTEVRS